MDSVVDNTKYNISEVLKKGEEIDLSANDIERGTNGKAKVVVYHDLGKYSNIVDLFQRNNTKFIALLYEVRENNGHWICLILRDNSSARGGPPYNLEIFDSYGFGSIDYELRYAVYDKTPYLKQLIGKSRALGQIGSVDVSDKKLQRHEDDVNTCGRYVVVRVRFGNMSNEEFEKFILTQSLHPDEYVTAMTLHLHQE